MDSLIVENVRCFHKRQSPRLAPLTLLVGENSSGKSTFLALLRVAWDVARGARIVDFNEAPFSLGTYEQIATYRGGRGGRAKEFTLGFDLLLEPHPAHADAPSSARVSARFEPSSGQPAVKEWSLEAEGFRIELSYGGKQGPETIKAKAPSGKIEIPGALVPISSLEYLGLMIQHYGAPTRQDKEQLHILGTITSPGDLATIQQLCTRVGLTLGPRPYAFAPIRTRPHRTYDPLQSAPEPEGSHVPTVLARTHGLAQDEWKVLKSSLNEFGTSSGLFTDINVKRMGQKESDPFQIRVRIGGPAFNLLDVGYGVSQALPIIVDCLRDAQPGTYLLQQPEVHLHPRAQAALGTFLGVLAKTQRKRFIVETHSDYLLDRIRMDVREKKHLTPRDISILYFERRGSAVRIYPLDVDDFGNLRGAPKGYRRFFLQEERRFLVS